MQVTISGDIGSGKSTVGEYLASVLGAELVDCGQLYRKYAEQVDMDVLQLNQSGDNSIDTKIDNELIRMGEEDKPRVYISRTAWHFIPNAIHVYMSINPTLAAMRILNRKTVAEKHDSLDSIIEYNRERINREDARYKEMYGITREQQLEDVNILMCVGNESIDTVRLAAHEIIDKGTVMCFDPRTAVPTQVLRDVSPEVVKGYCKEIAGDVVQCDVKMQFVDGVPYIVSGHHTIAAACINGVKFVYTRDFSIANRPICTLGKSDYYDWEDYIHGDLSAVIE